MTAWVVQQQLFYYVLVRIRKIAENLRFSRFAKDKRTGTEILTWENVAK
jgi:hypothetical protein